MEWLLTRLNDFFSKFTIECAIPADKQMHFLSGASGAFLLTILIGAWSIVAVSIAAAFKEFYDYHHPNIHTADVWDFLATSLGAVIGYLLFTGVIWLY